MEDDPRIGMIEDYLERLLPEDWAEMDRYQRRQYIQGDEFTAPKTGTVQRDKICAAEVMYELFGQDPGKNTRYEAKEINGILTRIPGWERLSTPRRFGIYGNQKGFQRKPVMSQEVTT